MRSIIAIGGLAAVWVVMVGTPATAEVLDAVYRGTMLCEKLPFTKANQREALEVTIDQGKVHYTHVVRLREAPELKPRRGASAAGQVGIPTANRLRDRKSDTPGRALGR